jgi:hypothetical protein
LSLVGVSALKKAYPMTAPPKYCALLVRVERSRQRRRDDEAAAAEVDERDERRGGVKAEDSVGAIPRMLWTGLRKKAAYLPG